MTDVHGSWTPRLAPLADALASSIESGDDLGAGVAVTIEGELAAHIVGGWQDRLKQTPWTEQSLPCIYSSGKAVLAVLVARAVEQGLLDYEAPVVDIWPEFGAAGKCDITIAMALSHQAGLCGLSEEMSPETWLDWYAICAKIAAQAPLWEPNAANGPNLVSGYHPQTFGFIAGELLRRVTGRTVGDLLREDFFESDGIEVHCGLDDAAFQRSLKMIKPPAAPDLGEINQYTKLAFLTPWASTAKVAPQEWAGAEIPASNMHANAAGLARLITPFANQGSLEGKAYISHATLQAATKARVNGEDLVLPFNLSWAAGVMRNNNLVFGPNEATLGHSGFGGSCVFADPDKRLTFSYVMNKMSPALMGDPRSLKLIEAVYAVL